MTDEPDDYSTHEILHLTSVVARLIDTELAEHPAMKTHPQWLDRVYQISSELADLYQEIGEEHLSNPKG